jgi:N6-L-threonylcarbamoyladenine synthase
MPRAGLILAIESSCDETAAAIVERGSRTLSSVVASQIATHARYGGVVPELASREHLRAIVPVVRAALAQANVTLADLDAIAVTSGPGLAGALLVGITYAKALAFAQGLPLIAVNHLEGHIHAVLLNEREQQSALKQNDLKHGASVQGDLKHGALKGHDFSRAEKPTKLTGALAPEVHPSATDEEISSAPSNPPGAPGLAFETWESTDDLKGTGFSPCMNQPEDQRALAPEVSSQITSQQPAPATPQQGTGRSPVAPPDAQSALALVVSGGHTHLYLARPIQNTWRYTLIGRTLDDAAGEAYDKVAKLLGLGYPGGPWIDALAQHGNPLAVPFAFSQIKTKLHLAGKPPRTKAALTAPIAELDPHFLFSFSGIKTAVLRYVELHNLRPEAESRREALFSGPDAPGSPRPVGAPGLDFETWESKERNRRRAQPTIEDALANTEQQTLDLIASFQHAVVGDLMKKTFAAAESLGVRRILVTGGVAANRELRARFTTEAARRNLTVSFPTLTLSTDNAAMIAAAAWPRFLAADFAPSNLSADPSLALGR